jgi:hypothetical protein
MRLGVGSIDGGRQGSRVHRNQRHRAAVDSRASRRGRRGEVGAYAGSKKAARSNFFQRREYAAGSERESVIVRQRQRVEAQGFQFVEHVGLRIDGAANGRQRASHHRPAAVPPGDSGLQIGE